MDGVVKEHGNELVDDTGINFFAKKSIQMLSTNSFTDKNT